MTGVAAQLLTIIAFTAHVIAGCCAHHSHHQHLHEAQTAVAGKPSQGCGHAHTLACSEDHGNAGRSAGVDEHHPSPAEEPCDGGHSCSEGTCQYLVGKSLELPVLGCLPGVVTSASHLSPARLLADLRVSHIEDDQLSPATSASRCALLQTWQI